MDKEKQRTVKRWERKVAEAEARVAEVEARLEAVNAELAAADPSDWQTFQAKLDGQKQVESDLAYAMAEWEEAQTALEEAQA